MKIDITVIRACEMQIEVEADNLAEAKERAIEIACNRDWSGCEAEYTALYEDEDDALLFGEFDSDIERRAKN